MKLKPDNFSSNHVHRLFHGSVLICHIAILASLTLGLIMPLIQIQGATVEDADNFEHITAQVGDLEPVTPPIDTTPHGFPENPAYFPEVGKGVDPFKPTIDPNIQYKSPIVLYIEAKDCVDQTQIPEVTEGPVCIVENPFPIFWGKNIIPFADVQMDLDHSGSFENTKADEDGYFNHKLSNPLTPGKHTFRAVIFDPQTGKKMFTGELTFIAQKVKISDIPSTPPTGGKPITPDRIPQPTTVTSVGEESFIRVSIPKNKKNLLQGGIVTVEIVIVNGSKLKTPRTVNLKLTITNPKGIRQVESNESIKYTDFYYTQKNFRINQYARIGLYTALGTVFFSQNGENLSSKDTFTVNRRWTTPLSTTNKRDLVIQFIMYGVASISILAFIIYYLIKFFYHHSQITKKEHAFNSFIHKLHSHSK